MQCAHSTHSQINEFIRVFDRDFVTCFTPRIFIDVDIQIAKRIDLRNLINIDTVVDVYFKFVPNILQ